ncbi:MAG: hypothetical protein BJ554DRAFT_3523 [Olpidium bornovanus]|uniref:Uncharacterized protein n=1 Tax=Olpidium bornovanus TaxID=278681 RepID=A0A8H7ZP06_9FUNG|nr:MAG: hypothetical protein BJ554DRAFT_3523 [Olpidium bornovanus]
MHVALASLACALLAARGLRSKSLSPDGAAAAVAVGMATFTAPYKAAVKKKLEEEYREGGQRNHVQVLSNGALGALLALIYTAFVGGGRPTCPPPSIPDAWWGSTEACILLMYLGHRFTTVDVIFLAGEKALRLLLRGHRKSFAKRNLSGDLVLLDTAPATSPLPSQLPAQWASELGVLQKTWPVLITTLKPVGSALTLACALRWNWDDLCMLARALFVLGITTARSLVRCWSWVNACSPGHKRWSLAPRASGFHSGGPFYRRCYGDLVSRMPHIPVMGRLSRNRSGDRPLWFLGELMRAYDFFEISAGPPTSNASDGA